MADFAHGTVVRRLSEFNYTIKLRPCPLLEASEFHAVRAPPYPVPIVAVHLVLILLGRCMADVLATERRHLSSRLINLEEQFEGPDEVLVEVNSYDPRLPLLRDYPKYLPPCMFYRMWCWQVSPPFIVRV